MTLPKRYDPTATLWAAVLVLALAYGLMMSSARQKSATVDEQSHLFRGAAYLREGATHFLLGHPLLGGVIAALPLLTEPDLRLPLNTPAWESGDWSLAGNAFLWQVNDNPLRLIFLGRLPAIWLTLLLGALLYRWGREMAGNKAAWLALFLLLLDPNVLANGRLITDDLPVTLFFTVAVYGYWRWAAGRSSPTGNVLLTGVGLGLAGAAKFNAALLLPILGAIGLGLAWQRRSWRPLAVLMAAGLVGWGVIWAVYGFAIRPLPGGAFWDDLFWVLDYFGKPHGAYLAGRVSADGWWYYFLIVFLLKTPLPTLLLLAYAFSRRPSSLLRSPSSLFLLLPPAAYLAISLTSSLNIGYRHLLPMLPFLFLFTAVKIHHSPFTIHHSPFSIIHSLLLAGGTAVLLFTTLFTWPDYISYFNLLAGGDGWRILSDSNVDWGQDLPALADWQQDQNQPPLKLSYFGTAHPSAYGVAFEPLPTWPPGPEQGDPALQAYNPSDPAPGLYAISVTNLHGVVLGQERDAFNWFRRREPLARIGGSMFVYEVAPRGEATDLALSHLRPGQLSPDLQARLGTNDARLRWFDAASSFIWPAGGGWLAVPADAPIGPALAAFWPESGISSADASQTLYRLPAPPPFAWPGAGAGVKADDRVTFLGYQRLAAEAGEAALLTAWRVNEATDRPLKIFVHALDESDQIIGQWDGLDVVPTSWLPGDVFVQLHRFAVASQDGSVSLATGMYDGETLTRITTYILLED